VPPHIRVPNDDVVEEHITLPRNLFIAVAVPGLATYIFSLGPVNNGQATVGWDGRFAVLAALCAMLGMLAKQNPLPLATAVLATMGFLEALSSTLTASDRGWAMTVIVIVNALQAAAAVAALMLAPKAAQDSAAAAGYAAYVDYYNEAVRNYYSQQGQPAPPEQPQRAGYGQAYADAQAAVRVQRTQRPSQHGDYADLDYSDSRPTAPHRDVEGSAPTPTGLPSFGPAGTRADQALREADDDDAHVDGG
jgi:hypothetical protein